MICGALKITGGADFISVGPYIAEHMKTDLLADLFANIRTTTTFDMIADRIRGAMAKTHVSSCPTLDTLLEYKAGRAADTGSSPAQLATLLPKVLAAIEKQDLARLDEITIWPIHNVNLWFGAQSCQQEFGGVASVAKSRARELLSCLAGFGRAVETYPDLGAATFEPGFGFMLRTSNGKLTGLFTPGAEVDVPKIGPLDIGPKFFAKHLPSGSFDVVPDPTTRDAIAKNPQGIATVVLQACADVDGAVRVKLIEKTGDKYPEYAQHVLDAAKAWKAKPFQIQGHAVPVCTTATITYSGPNARRAPPPPPPPPPR